MRVCSDLGGEALRGALEPGALQVEAQACTCPLPPCSPSRNLPGPPSAVGLSLGEGERSLGDGAVPLPRPLV